MMRTLALYFEGKYSDIRVNLKKKKSYTCNHELCQHFLTNMYQKLHQINGAINNNLQLYLFSVHIDEHTCNIFYKVITQAFMSS